jgi:D-3-phosphoglycerate dehydrogenase
MVNILIAESLHVSTLRTFANTQNISIHESHAREHNAVVELNFHYLPDITVAEMEESIHLYDGLIVRPKTVNSKTISNGKNLKLIIRGGSGVNTIDLEAAKQHRVAVENTPGQNSIATTEFAFNFFSQLQSQKKIMDAHNEVMAIDDLDSIKGDELICQCRGYELKGKTLAIIGLGAIGQAVAKRAVAFEMDAIAYSGSFVKGTTDERVTKLGIKQANSMLEAINDADIITLHTPLTDSTNAMVNADFFANIKKGALLVNTARPQLVEVSAFEEALKSNILGGYAVDGDLDIIVPYIKVAKKYPNANIILTPHIADATDEAQMNITNECCKQILAYFRDDREINRVA